MDYNKFPWGEACNEETLDKTAVVGFLNQKIYNRKLLGRGLLLFVICLVVFMFSPLDRLTIYVIPEVVIMAGYVIKYYTNPYRPLNGFMQLIFLAAFVYLGINIVFIL